MIKNVVSYLIEPKKFNNKVQVLPDAIPHEYVRVKYLYCGICGGDYSRYMGYRAEYPISLGHEFVAEVIGINCDVETDYKTGDFVVSDFNYRCMTCHYCQNNKTHLCIKNSLEKFTNRAFALYADIHYTYLVKTNIPQNYIYRATLVEPLSCIIHAMDFYDLSRIRSVLIYGTGNIGMLCAFYLSQCHDKHVFLYDVNAQKMYAIADLFMCEKADFTKTYDLVIEATNSPNGLLNCLAGVKYNPNICSFSHLYGQNTEEIYNCLVQKESNIYFPLRNGAKNTLHQATQIIETFWSHSYDRLIKIYKTNDINFPFEEKISCVEPKQIINFSIDE